jgi:murein L,D-transpeptidase YcbB/YkuD
VDELGVINYRRDIYGRDAAIYEALIKAGIQAKSLYGQKLKKTG